MSNSFYLKTLPCIEISKGMVANVTIDLSSIQLASGQKVRFTIRHMRSREVIYEHDFTSASSNSIVISTDITKNMNISTTDYKYQLALVGSDSEPEALCDISPVHVLNSAGGVC